MTPRPRTASTTAANLQRADQATHGVRLWQFLAWLLPIAYGFAVLELLVFLLVRDSTVGIALAITVSYISCLLVARWLLRRNRWDAALAVIGGGLLGVAIVVMLVWSLLLPALALLPLIVVMLALPYRAGPSLRRLILICWAVMVLLALLGEVVAPVVQPPPWVTSVLRVSTLSAAAALVLLLLWQFSSRLTETLSHTQAANAALCVAQTRLEAQRERLTVTLHSIGDGVITTDVDGMVGMLNPVAATLTGWPAPDALAQPVTTVLPIIDAETGASLPDLVAAVLAVNDVVVLDAAAVLRARDGVQRPIAGSAAPVHDRSGQIVSVVLVFRDLTDRLQAEQARRAWERTLQETQKLESLGVLAGGIAHDFNNLLTGMLGNASLALLDLPPDAPAYASVAQIEVAAQRAAELTRQLLAYSGRGRFTVQRLDLNVLVSEMLTLVQSSIAKTVSLQLHLTPQLPTIDADATQLRQVVMNLVVNASEAMGAQPGTMTVTTGVRDVTRAELAQTYLALDVPAGTYISFAVADTGSGMDARTRGKIFEPFFTTKFTGRGLGLAAVLGIVRGHHGALTVDSTPGRGTTFTSLLPAAGEPLDSLPARPGPTTRWRGHGTVLVIDDDAEVRGFVGRALEYAGFTVLTAADGQQGVDVFRQEAATITWVLLDLTMPVLNGGMTFHAIRHIKADARVVLMSGYSEQEATAHFVGDGLAGFLQKPFTIADLETQLQQAVP